MIVFQSMLQDVITNPCSGYLLLLHKFWYCWAGECTIIHYRMTLFDAQGLFWTAFELIKDTPNLGLMGERWGVYHKKSKLYFIISVPFVSRSELQVNKGNPYIVMTWKRFPYCWPLWGESTGHEWILLTNGQWWGSLMICLLLGWTSCWTKSWVVGNSRHHYAHVMLL